MSKQTIYKLILVFTISITILISTCKASNETASNQKSNPVVSASWQIFRGNPALTGIAQGKLNDSLKLKWRFKTGESIKSSPVVDGGKVYIGSGDGNVYALNLSDGQQVWAFKTEDMVESPPCVLNGSVFVGSSDSYLYAIDAKNGTLKWKYKTGAKILGSPNWTKSPKNNGIWILVGSYDNYLHCVDSVTGKLIWKYETTNYINGSPAIAGGKAVFGGCDAKVHAISIINGKKLAEIETSAYIAGSAALADKYAYVGNYQGEFVCVDLTAKKIIWTYKNEGNPFFSSPAIGSTQVVFGSRDNRLHCVRRDNGKPIWTFQAQDKVDSSPVIVGDKLIVGSDDGRIYMVSLSNGKELWSYEIGSAITGSPAVVNGIVIIGADDGVVYAFE